MKKFKLWYICACSTEASHSESSFSKRSLSAKMLVTYIVRCILYNTKVCHNSRVVLPHSSNSVTIVTVLLDVVLPRYIVMETVLRHKRAQLYMCKTTMADRVHIHVCHVVQVMYMYLSWFPSRRSSDMMLYLKS